MILCYEKLNSMSLPSFPWCWTISRFSMTGRNPEKAAGMVVELDSDFSQEVFKSLETFCHSKINQPGCLIPCSVLG